MSVTGADLHNLFNSFDVLVISRPLFIPITCGTYLGLSKFKILNYEISVENSLLMSEVLIFENFKCVKPHVSTTINSKSPKPLVLISKKRNKDSWPSDPTCEKNIFVIDRRNLRICKTDAKQFLSTIKSLITYLLLTSNAP